MQTSVAPLRSDPWQLVTWMERLEELTNLSFQLAARSERDDAPWQPQFDQSGDTLDYWVVTSGGELLQGSLARGEGPSFETARRLISLACGQMRAEQSEGRLGNELLELTTHTLEMYEQISTLHQLARCMTLERGEDAVQTELLETLARSLPADNCTLAASIHDPRPEQICRREPHPVVVRRTLGGKGVDQPAEQWLAVGLSVPHGPQQWLVAQRSADAPEFQSPEGLLMQSVAAMYEAYLSNRAMFDEQEALLLGFVRSLVATIDARDHYTCGHSERVAAFAALLARQLGLSSSDVDRIYTCGLLHDVGKVGIQDAVLRKPGDLTATEWEEIRRHPVIGDDILRPLKAFDDLRPGVRNHHEAWDGSGYPDGLQGEQIPWMARILAVADAFDAMASDRPYRAGMSLKMVDEILQAGSGRQWCPDVILAYRHCRKDLVQVWLKAQPHQAPCEHRA